VTAAEIRGLFPDPRGVTYLDTASYGLPPRRTLEALGEALAGWEAGTADWEQWELLAEQCRSEFAALVGAGREEIALLPAVSVASGLVASALSEGEEVLLAEGDFRSVGYPFLAAQERHGIEVREAPFHALAEAITDETRLVAVSYVHSATGQVADLAAIRRRATEAGALVYLDATQALGVLPLEVRTAKVDALSCAGYKWLCTPRGVAFLYLRSDFPAHPFPFAASWRAAPREGVEAGLYYGSPLVLDETMRRFDISLPWHSWVGALPSLQAIGSVPPELRRELACAGVRRLASDLGVPPPASSILSVEVAASAAASERLATAGIKASVRAGRVRFSSHLYNGADDGSRAAEVLADLVGETDVS
jgi:selenocysteine lyase/cysteine desulfurase